MTSNGVFEIFAAGQKVGIVVARSATLALESAHYATTRRTDSKIDVSCDYAGLFVRKLGARITPMGETLSDASLQHGHTHSDHMTLPHTQ